MFVGAGRGWEFCALCEPTLLCTARDFFIFYFCVMFYHTTYFHHQPFLRSVLKTRFPYKKLFDHHSPLSNGINFFYLPSFIALSVTSIIVLPSHTLRWGSLVYFLPKCFSCLKSWITIYLFKIALSFQTLEENAIVPSFISFWSDWFQIFLGKSLLSSFIAGPFRTLEGVDILASFQDTIPSSAIILCWGGFVYFFATCIVPFLIPELLIFRFPKTSSIILHCSVIPCY